MKLLLFDSDAEASRPLSAALTVPGREVQLALDESAALAALARGRVGVALFVARAGLEAATRVARQARHLPGAREGLFALVTRELNERAQLEAFEAGFDVDLPLGAPPGALALRIAALERLVSGNRKAAPVAVPQPAPAPAAAAPAKGAAAAGAVALTPFEQVTRSAAWRGAAPAFQAAATTFLTLPVALSDAAPGALASASRIVLLNAEHELELGITVGVSAKTGSHLAVHLFGPENESLAADVLSELANIFMGSMKTALSAESFAFTGGLPQQVAADEVLRPSVTFKQQELIALSVGDGVVQLHVGLRSRANQRLTLGELREGMVVACDIMNARGLMLLNKGTRLSQNMIDRLRANLAEKAKVEVTTP